MIATEIFSFHTLRRCYKAVKQPDITALKEPDIAEKCRIEVCNKYEVLMAEGVEQNNNTDDQNIPQIELEWNCLKNSIACGRPTLSTKKKLVNQPWMKNEILDLMKGKPRMSNEYKTINKKIDTKSQEAKEEWMVAKCKTIEQLSRTHQTTICTRKLSHLPKNKTLPRADISEGQINLPV